MKSLCRKKVSSQVHSDDVSILKKKKIYIYSIYKWKIIKFETQKEEKCWAAAIVWE